MRGVEIVVSQRQGLEGLGPLWRELEARVPTCSFFRSWSWVGCLVEERFPDPVLFQAHQGATLVGLALFNRRGGRLCLGESGDRALDAPFVEHNGPLTLGLPGLEATMLRAAAGLRGARRLVLGGVPAAVLAEAPGTVLRLQERLAPFIRLEAVRAAGGDPLALVSANARHQIRRSARHYGALSVTRATSEAEAQALLEELITLHQRSWQARGQPGAFAQDFQRRFHATLLRRAMARHEIELLRVESARGRVGLLYNFRHRGRVCAYQSAFELEGAGPHAKPGLTCHVLAIAAAAARGDAIYDFLGGADRYKLTLAQQSEPLFWAELVRSRSLMGLALRLRHFVHGHALAQSRRGSSASADGAG